MKASTIFTTLAAAIPAFAAPSTFGGIAVHSTAEYHLSAINATGSEIWIGRPNSASCPSNIPASNCPSGDRTLFTASGSQLSLAVSVPGGQQIYVAADGSLGYTQPHSASMPAGSSATGFEVVDNGIHLKYNQKDFLAVPIGDAWKVYASVEGAPKNGSSFVFRNTEATEKAGAWEY